MENTRAQSFPTGGCARFLFVPRTPAIHPVLPPLHPKPMAGPIHRVILTSHPPHTMHLKRTENRVTPTSARRTRYRVINHQEAGLFDSMTVATLWAIKNVSDWNWRIEPVSGSHEM